MFHEYVSRARGKPVDIGRAQFLMDKELAQQTAEWVEENWPEIKEGGGSTQAQAFWDYYCQRHVEKHGTYFTPDVDPEWK